MSSFYNWEDVLKVEGIKHAVLNFAKSGRSYENLKVYLNDDGTLPEDEGDLQYLFESAISEDGKCVFYFSNDGTEQILSHSHKKFHGVYFEFDGNGMITGPLTYNDPAHILDMAGDNIETYSEDETPRDGFCVSVGGEFPDEFFTKHCLKVVTVGQNLEINGRVYLRTEAGFELKK